MVMNRVRNICMLKKQWCHSKAGQDFTVQVPWGHIAGIEHGNCKNPPVLGLHGWLDNAGTFSGLTSYLKDNFHFVAIDFPGHGLSSHYPKGFDYPPIFAISTIKRVAAHFKWEKFSIVGHSMGGGIGMLFAGTFPEVIEKLIMIDLVKLISVDPDDIPNVVRNAFETLHQLEQKSTPVEPSYTFEQAKKKLIASHGSPLTENAALSLLKRGLQKRKNDNNFSFTRDIRVAKVFGPQKFTTDVLKSFSTKLKCDMMLIKAKDAPFYQDEELCMSFIKLYEKHAKSFKYIEVSGDHHVHLNNPEAVGPIIKEFLSS